MFSLFSSQFNQMKKIGKKKRGKRNFMLSKSNQKREEKSTPKGRPKLINDGQKER